MRKKGINFIERHEKGITLIALVITIIVLLILAGVSIATLTGPNGLLARANESKEQTKIGEEKEKMALAVSTATIDNKDYKNLTSDNLQHEMDEQFGIGKTSVIDNGNETFTVRFKEMQKEYNITSNGISEGLNWKEIMKNAKKQEEQIRNDVMAIGTDGKIVNMDLWNFSFDEKTQGYALNSSEALTDTSLRIAGYRGKINEDGTIVGTIPQYIKEIDGEWKPVTSLWRTFQGNDTTNEELKKLTTMPVIPNTVKAMNMTFEFCESLTKTSIIPGSVEILRWTFDGYTGLEEMPIISYGVKDMTGAFSGCSKLKKVTEIPNSVTTLEGTFVDCTSLIQAPNIPYSVINLNCTFRGCHNLEKGPSVISENVDNMQQTFDTCFKLSGTMEINANPTSYINCFYKTSTEATVPLVVTGKSTILNKLVYGTLVTIK